MQDDCWQSNKRATRNGHMNNHIDESNRAPLNALPTVRPTINETVWETGSRNLEQTPLNRC